MGRAEAPEAPESRFPCALPPPAVLSPAATCAPPLPATPEPSAASLALEGWLLAPEAGALISLRVAPSPRTERAPAGPAREGLPAWSPSVSRRVERAQPGRMTSPAAAQSREIDCLSPEAQRLAEARLAAKRAARAEAREIRMKELERQQKEIYQVQKKYYGLDTKWGDIEQWMEDSERYSRRSRRNTSASDEDERMSVGSRGSLRSQPDLEYGGPYAWPSCLYSAARPSGSYRASVLDEGSFGGARRGSISGSRAPSEYSGHLNSSSRASSRASSARASPVVEDRPEKDFTEKGSRNMPGLSAATLASLGGTSSRRGSGDTSISIDTEASIREIKELNELKDQIQDVEGKYMQGLKEMKDSLAEVEEKYKKAMVSNAQLDNEKTNFMYQVDTLKDMMLELEEQLAESRRQYEEKNKEFEREKHAHSILQFQFAEVKEALKQREEMLEKHGIILNSEIATNGETSDTLNNFGYQGPSKMTKEELNALKSTGDGTLGRASEVEVKNEIVANVGKREILHNTEKEQHTEDTVKDCVDIEVFPAGENTEDQKSSEDTAPFLGTLAGATYEEQVQNQILESTSLPENTAQAESDEVMGAPDDRTRTPLEPSSCWNDLDGGNHTGNVGEAAATQVGEQAGTVASCPLGHSDDTVYHDDKCTVEVPQELETSTGHSLEKEFTNLEAAEPKEVPVQSTEVGRDHNEEEDEETVLRDEKPIKTEVPGSPAGTESNGQEATGPSTVDTQSESLDMKEPEEEKNDQQGEALDSSQKKTKNKKKKNKKKKSPVPVETLKDVKKELTYQNTDLSEIKEEEQVKSTDRKSAVEAQNEAPENPKQKIAAESSENADCPENPKIKLAGKLDQEGDDVKTAAEVVLADGDTLDFEDDTVQSLGPRAGGEELDDGVAKDNAKTDGATQSSPAEPESEDADSCTLPENESPSQDLSDACEAESTERCGMSEHPSQTVRKALDSNSLENDDLSALGGEPGDFNPESREDTREGNEKGKSKEDCTMS
ncbi:leucine-rich repeat flightless-interacting protein 1 isoform X15 [Trachypithecus francoisi]|uniref:leucine-rich repeat flightless-interacting protein 1 isoform X15 n=1 Tax=Trachypithecus francoisi TaxID=54180 RepID=UPI00141B100C|nr:leucine-rich repeat flightless-interacting protein 1 isoform X15 [Trachypithecus francoisi]